MKYMYMYMKMQLTLSLVQIVFKSIGSLMIS